jgi:hypothetical protein
MNHPAIKLVGAVVLLYWNWGGAFAAEILRCKPENRYSEIPILPNMSIPPDKECRAGIQKCGYDGDPPPPPFDIPMSSLKGDDVSFHVESTDDQGRKALSTKLTISRVNGEFLLVQTTDYITESGIIFTASIVTTKGHCERRDVNTKF